MTQLLAGRYEVGELVARGGMAHVYRGRDHELDREVAIKMLGPHLGSDERASRRLRREARVAASLDHPHVVRVLDIIGPEHGTQAIVMESLPGRTLADEIWDNGPADYDELMAIATALVSGLAVAHAAELIHRDIKTSNILLTEDRTPKIADFGIATGPNLTATSTVHGSIHYMAPEQAMGRESDPRTDLYGFGCVLYEMLTGSTPFSGTTAEIIEQHLQSEPRPVSELRSNVPAGLEQLTMRLLSKDPRDRPASAGDVLEALERLREDPDATIDDLLPDLPVSGREPMRALSATEAANRIARMTPPDGGTGTTELGDVAVPLDEDRSPNWLALGIAAVILAVLAVLVLPRLVGGTDVPKRLELPTIESSTGQE